jgi:signal transduction histidine kinase
MRERAAAIGARLEVRDGASGGTVVTLDLPVAGHERPADPDRAPDAIPAAAAQRTS